MLRDPSILKLFDLDLLNLYRCALDVKPVIGCNKVIPDFKSLVLDGQSNYVSTNILIDSFVQYRQKSGLVVSVMDIGPADDVGYIDRTASMREPLLYNSTRPSTVLGHNSIDSWEPPGFW